MLGIIAEYNPFHNGHLFHLNKSKKITKNINSIAVMSGNFVQRGEPSIFDKYIRTKMALLSGIDVVIELPTIFATSSAELFALGSIDILNKTNVISDICFGSEQGNITELTKISNVLVNEPFEFKNLLKLELKKGISFPKARSLALNKYLNLDTNFLNNPNNILSLEYLKALNILNSTIKPSTILREKNDFHSVNISNSISSATSIREAILKNDFGNIKYTMPNNIFELVEVLIKNKIYPNIDDYSTILSYILKTSSIPNLTNIYGMIEGLENKILQNSDFDKISNLIYSIKSKRYTYTKLKRLLLHIILNITKDDYIYHNKNLATYIRILGFKKSSSDIVSKIVKNASVPVILNLKKASTLLSPKDFMYLQKDIIATDIYYLSHSKKCINEEYKVPLVIV